MPGATGGNMEPLGERKRIFGGMAQPPQPQPHQPQQQPISIDALDARLAEEFDIQTLAAVAAANYAAAADVGGLLGAAADDYDPAYTAEAPEKDSAPSRSEKKRHKDKDKDRERRRDKSKDRSSRRHRDKDRERDERDRRRSKSPRRRSRRSRSPHDRDQADGKPRRSRFDLKTKEGDGSMYGPSVPPQLAPVMGAAPAPGVPPPIPAPPPNLKMELPELKQEENFAEERKRKRKSRWGEPTQKAFVPGMPTMIPSNLSEDQQRAYLLQLQIEECSRKLRSGEFGINPDPAKRSPSPEPVYDTHGKRLNTREVRYKQKLEKERHEAIQEMIKLNPMFKPPPDYKMPVIKLHEKVWIPQDDHPEVNFVGLLLGPRGNTLKSLERETGARIIIRGKGSVKEGKFSKFQGPMPGEDEPLHAYITSTDPEIIKGAVEKIQTILEQAVEVPDGQNELRKLQLRELALLNGTLRPEDLLSGGRCSNCGANTHKSWECPDAPNVTANVICTACGGAGHISRDCKNPKPGAAYAGFNTEGDMSGGLDEEYSALMAELGQDGGERGGGRAPLRRGPFGRGGGRDSDPGGEADSGYGGRRRPEPIVRINLAQPNRPKPPSLMSLNVGSGGQQEAQPAPAGGAQGGGMMPPWGWPPMPPGMMLPPMPGAEGKDGQGQMPWMPPMYPGMMGMVPPPPPTSTGDSDKKADSATSGDSMSMMMPPFMGMGMPPMMPWGMAPPPPPTSTAETTGDLGPAPVPPPPLGGGPAGGMDFSSMLAPPPPPPPPPE